MHPHEAECQRRRRGDRGGASLYDDARRQKAGQSHADLGHAWNIPPESRDALGIPVPGAVWMSGNERRRVALICFHTSPLAQPGEQDAGGMNVYVRETAIQLAASGFDVNVFTRAASRSDRPQAICEGARVVPIVAGPASRVEKSRLLGYIDEFARGIASFRLRHGLRYELVHSHYWLSAQAGQQLAWRWAVPHVVMFHTLGQVKNRSRMGRARAAEPYSSRTRRGADGRPHHLCYRPRGLAAPEPLRRLKRSTRRHPVRSRRSTLQSAARRGRAAPQVGGRSI